MGPKITWKSILKLRSTQERAKSRLRGQLQANLGQLGLKKTSTWAQHGPSWKNLSLLGAKADFEQKPWISNGKTMILQGPQRPTNDAKNARGQLGPTRAIFEQLGTTLAQSWPNLEPTWDQLEPSLDQLGANLVPIWTNLDQHGDNLGHCGPL